MLSIVRHLSSGTGALEFNASDVQSEERFTLPADLMASEEHEIACELRGVVCWAMEGEHI